MPERSSAAAVPQPRPLRIAALFPFEPDEIERIRAAAPKAALDITVCSTPAELLEAARDAEVIYGDVGQAVLEAAPRLKWVQWPAAGIDTMDAAMRASGVVVTNFQRTFAPGISETAMGLLLCLTRGLAKYYMPQFYRERTMKPVGTLKSEHHCELAGQTMGIVGLGGIGDAVARRAYYGFDMRIVATDPKPLCKPDYVEVLREPAWFDEMVPQADVLVAAAPLTDATRRMFDERIFRAMKPSAHFLALSRGELFDDMALVRALREGWIAGAGLDVFPVEPPPSNHPIFDCPNVVMSAHTSGWSPARQQRLVAAFAENVRRYSEGLPLLNLVDKQAGY